MFRNFDEILELVKNDTQKTIAVAMAEDADVLKALEKARSMGLAKSFLTGNAEKIYELMSTHGIDKNNYEVINSISEIESIESAVVQVKSGKAQVLMKGLCSTSVFLKGVLDKNNGLRSGKVLSHLAVFESPQYHKLFMLSDAAMNIAPDLSTKIVITENAISAALRLGYEKPKIAIISAVEKINPDGIPSTVDAAIISKMNERNQIKNAIIDGPLAVDNALSEQSCIVKGLNTQVGGDADILIVPNIETGNACYKLLTILGNAKVAGIIVGATAPIVLTSRADSDESKFLSIVTALKAS
ncbi:MAG: bifunctional enoyl-CoA hydratase/phosphate acetyltransferase [Calditrichia bacterium]|nr:bifunctional enoyl-CoA hydratase/phosphate acetyltransferase [Calditrichia bacterium]